MGGTLLNQNREPRELRPRAAFFAVMATLFFLLIVGRLYHLQLVRGDELSLRSRDNYVKELVEPADRGLVLDHRGRVLADNRPSFDVYLTPAFCTDPDEVIGRLSVHLGLTEDEIEAAHRNFSRARGLERFRPFLVKLDINRDQLDVVEAELARLEGVDIIPSPHRHYRFGSLLAHVVGYMSEVTQAEFEKAKGAYRRGDFVGRRGIERALESQLKGVDGRQRIAVDARGKALEPELANLLIAEDARRVPSQPGNNVVLSIDLGLQHIADLAMREGALAGSLVVVDVHTGYILAMISHPSYDPNKMTGRISRKELQEIVNDPMEPLFQRAIQQHYHPGSTFKPFTALAGLEQGAVSLASATSCNGGYTLGRRRWRCWLDRGHGGGINLSKSLIHSCDVYYYWIADKIGLEPIADMAFRFGFGKPTGIELQPEAAGLIPTPEFHRRVDGHYTRGFALNASIGQGSVNVTSLQLAMGFAALANGGVLYKPQLVRRVESPDGEVLENHPPEVVRDLGIPQAHLNAVMQSLDHVVNLPGGTAYSRRLKDIRVAGKTGTAQVITLGERRRIEDVVWKERDHAWFAAIAPADEPEIAVVVLNEHGGGGSTAAAPIAMAAIQGYFDLKAREEELRKPLPPEMLMAMSPEPQFAWPQRIRQVPLPPPDPVYFTADESSSTTSRGTSRTTTTTTASSNDTGSRATARPARATSRPAVTTGSTGTRGATGARAPAASRGAPGSDSTGSGSTGSGSASAGAASAAPSARGSGRAGSESPSAPSARANETAAGSGSFGGAQVRSGSTPASPTADDGPVSTPAEVANPSLLRLPDSGDSGSANTERARAESE